MTAPLELLEIQNRQQWRSWLEKHHAASPGVGLVYHKKHTGRKSIPYENSVREALCFGWIDSLMWFLAALVILQVGIFATAGSCGPDACLRYRRYVHRDRGGRHRQQPRSAPGGTEDQIRSRS